MDIIRLGHSSFKIRGKQAIVVTDPFDGGVVGFKFPKVEAAVVTISHNHSDHNFLSGVLGNPFVIQGPGEYEVSGVFIRGIAAYHDGKSGALRGKNTIYKIEVDKVAIAHLGDLGHKLDDRQTDELGDIDVLLIPVGGIYTIDAKEAAEVVAQIEPRIVIPMHYREERLNRETFAKLGDLKGFFAEMGKDLKVLPRLTITKEKLPRELEVIALE